MKITALQASQCKFHSALMKMLKCSGENTADISVHFCLTDKMLLIQMLAYITVEEKRVEKQARIVTIGSSDRDLINIQSSHQFDQIASEQLVCFCWYTIPPVIQLQKRKQLFHFFSAWIENPHGKDAATHLHVLMQ